jgi:arginyl-tRNA synthetase
VAFDVFFSERALHEGTPSAVERGIERLSEQGHLYRSEGALWLRTTDFGDEKDRVLERSTGQPDVLRGRRGLRREQARARLRPARSSRWAAITTATSRG